MFFGNSHLYCLLEKTKQTALRMDLMRKAFAIEDGTFFNQ